MLSLTRYAPSKLVRTAVVLGLAASVLVTSSTSSRAASGGGDKTPTSGVVPASGPAEVAQMISLYGKGFATDTGNPLILDQTGHGVSFTAQKACAADVAAATTATQVDSDAVTIASATRLVISVPASAMPPAAAAAKGTPVVNYDAKKDYQVCVYAAATGSKLLASGKFTVFPAPTLAASNAIGPVSGPSVGGQTITVVGDTVTAPPSGNAASGYFSSKTSATLGGQPVTGIKVAKDGNSFTGVTPALPASSTPVDLVVTTEGGSVTATGAYTVVPAITVSPNLVAPAGGSVISIRGKGFLALKSLPGFGVLFVTGAFGPSNTGTPCPGTSVTVVSDKEIICTATPVLPASSYNVVVTDDTTGGLTGYTTIVSTGATVTAGSF